MLQHCLLCGDTPPTNTSHHSERIKALVLQKVCPGPIVYPATLAWEADTMNICKACYQQLWRMRRGKVQMLPLDTVVLQMMVPGLPRRQDTRTRMRIHAALRTNGNAYSQTFEPLNTMLQRPKEEQLDAWWKLNLQTEFFAHKHTARLLRHSGL
jgi:hypothetical protein